MKYIRFRNVKINNYDFQEIQQLIYRNIINKGFICLVEVSGIMRSGKDPELLRALNHSLVSIPDGAPLAWFGKILGCQKIEHLSGFSLMRRMIREDSKYKHFLLGDTERTIREVISKAKSITPSVRIEGYSPPFKDRFDKKDSEAMIKRINEANADIIWVSFGLGKQEKWMFENYSKINKGIMIGVGAAFKFYTGKITIPNLFMQRSGFTWLVRFRQGPRNYLKNRFFERLFFLYFFIIEIVKSLRDQKRYENKVSENLKKIQTIPMK